MLDAQQKEEIRLEAQSLLKRFSERLNKINLNAVPSTQEGTGMRLAGTAQQITGFRQRILDNAPTKNDDFIIAEKKKW